MSPYSNQSLVCSRCTTVMLPGAVICSTCCAPLTTQADADAAQSTPIAAAVPVPGGDDAGVFASWPFGGADTEVAAQVAASNAAKIAAAGVRQQLGTYAASPDASPAQTSTNSQNATHRMPSLPVQRTVAQPEPVRPDLESVPDSGPNPFLAAARLQRARDEAASTEAYTA